MLISTRGRYSLRVLLDLAPVACLGCDAQLCERAESCRTLPMWKEFCGMVNEYFDGITLADLMK